MLTLRPYQNEAHAAIYQHFEHSTGNPLIVLPTGTGKSLVIAEFLRCAYAAWPATKVIALAHVQELVEQNYLELTGLWPEAPAGIYSAGLNRRDLHDPIVFASIQSIYRRAYEIQRVDLIIVDEAHLISRNAQSMYGQFIADLLVINPALKVIGLTATPYRLDSGRLDMGKDAMFERVIFEYEIARAIAEGYLARPISKETATQLDTSQVGTRGGEFIAGQLERAVDIDSVTRIAVTEICDLGTDRRSWLIFCAGVSHAQHVTEELQQRGVPAAYITGDTPKDERARLIEDFKGQRIRALCNVGVLTTGFNAPSVDLIALLRPTKSTGLYVQMVGRGTRLYPGKENCLVLDFGGNARRHGPLDDLRISSKTDDAEPGDAPTKTCPDCRSIIHASARLCPDCGHEFPPPEKKIEQTASTAPILTDFTAALEKLKPREYEVMWYDYATHQKKQQGTETPTGPLMLVVCYYTTCGGQFREWVCLEHEGYARKMAERWWFDHGGSLPAPSCVAEAHARVAELEDVTHIRIAKEPPKPGKKSYPRVVSHTSAPDRLSQEARDYRRMLDMADAVTANMPGEDSDEELPF